MKFEPTHLRLPNENDAEIDVRIEIENEMEIAYEIRLLHVANTA